MLKTKPEPKEDVIYFAKLTDDIEVFGTNRKFFKNQEVLVKEIEQEPTIKTVYSLDGRPINRWDYYNKETKKCEIPEDVAKNIVTEQITVPNIWVHAAIIDVENYEGKERELVKGWVTVKKSDISKIRKTSQVKIVKYPNFKKVKKV